MADELKPCPFCGGRAERIDFGPGSGDNEGGSCISCTGCQSSGPVEYGRKENFVSTWNSRMESATTPAEVDGEAASDDSIIARCEAVGIKWLEPDNVLPDGTIDLEGFPGSFDMATMQEMRALLADSATLARQLAEANKRADRAELTLGQYAETAAELGAQRNEARAQLAAATRRVAEVECLLQALLDYAEHGDITQMGRSFSEIKAAARTALTKEPTK